MTTYAVFAAHSHSNSDQPMSEVFRVKSKEVAEQCAEKMKKERFTEAATRRRLRRYSAVVVQELQE